MLFRVNYRSLLLDIINFIFIFSLFNDKFLVVRFGENTLRLLFVVFLFFNSVKIYRNLTNKSIMREMIPINIFLSLTIVLALINSPAGDWGKLFNNFLLIFAAFIIVVYYINYDRKKFMYFIWIAMIISVVILITNTTLSKYTFRKTGGTGDPNEFASQLLSFLFISIFLFRENRKILFMVISGAAFTYSIFFAGSMSSFLMLGVLTVFIVFRYLRLSVAKSLIGISTASLLLIIVLFSYHKEIAELKPVKNVLIRSEKSGTAVNRLHSWYAGIFMFADKPITGVGMNQYHIYSPKYAKAYLSKDSIAPHNLYIKVLAESGIIVFIALMFFLFDLMSKHFAKIISSDYFWIYMSVTAFLLMGLTLGLTYNKYLWLSFALLMNIHLRIRKENMHEITEENIKNIPELA